MKSTIRITLTTSLVIVGICVVASLLSRSSILIASSFTAQPETQWSQVGPYGGRIYSLKVDSVSDSIIYAGTETGLFITDNSGLSWHKSNLPKRRISSIEIDDADNERVYVTGSCDLISTSNDKGASWEPFTQGLDISNLSSGFCIKDFALNTSGNREYWLATTAGVYKRTLDNPQWSLTSLVTDTYLIKVQDTRVYAVTQLDIFVSTDGGANWQSIIGDIPSDSQSRRITALLPDISDSNILYVGTWYGGTYKTFDNGQHWIAVNNGLPPFTEVSDLILDPIHADTIYAASNSYFVSDVNQSGVYKSTNGGGYWSRVSEGLNDTYVRSLAIDPQQRNNIYAGTDGMGVHHSSDAGLSWEQITLGLTDLPINSFIESDNSVYAATKFDGIYRSIDNGLTWKRFNTGLPKSPVEAYDIAQDESSTLYITLHRHGIFKLSGDSWTKISDPIKETEVKTLDVIGNTLIATAVPNKQFGSVEVWVSYDLGSTWELHNSGLPNESLRIYSTYVHKVAGTSYVYAATSKGLFLSEAPNFNWASVEIKTDTNLEITDVAFDPRDPLKIYVAAGCSNIYISSDLGQKWQPSKNGLASTCVNSIAINPNLSNELIAGTNQGVFISRDDGAFWNKAGDWTSTLEGKDVEVTNDNSILFATDIGIVKSGSSPSPNPTITPKVPWTAMIYLSGDNDLDEEISYAFNQLEIAAKNPNIRIFVLWDRLGDHNTGEYLVQPDDNPNQLAQYEEQVNYWDRDEVNMADPKTLAQFITKARAKYPAEHYFLSIVDHGGGWSPKINSPQPLGRWSYGGGSGLSWDLTSNGDWLSTKDMGDIFTPLGLSQQGPIDVVFYDACLMAMFEEVYEIRNGAHYLIASQNETWTSFPYDKYLLDVKPDTTPEEFAKSVVTTYDKSLTNYPRTMSLFNLGQADNVSVKLNKLAEELKRSLPDSSQAISQAFSLTQKLDYNFDLDIQNNEGYVDLVDFAKNVQKMLPDTAVSSAAQDMVDIFSVGNPFLVIETHKSGFARRSGKELNLENVHGLSIYLPIGEADEDYNFYTDAQIDLLHVTMWEEFIREYLGHPSQIRIGKPRGNVAFPPSPRTEIFLPLIAR